MRVNCAFADSFKLRRRNALAEGFEQSAGTTAGGSLSATQPALRDKASVLISWIGLNEA